MKKWFNLGWFVSFVLVGTVLLEMTGNRWGTMSNTVLALLISTLLIQAVFHWFLINKYYLGKKSIDLAWVFAMPLLILLGIMFTELFVIGGLISVS